MPSYSLDIELPGEAPRYVPRHDFPNEMRAGDQFEHEGYTLRVTEVATKQFDAPGEPEKTLRCIPAEAAHPGFEKPPSRDILGQRI